MSAPCPLQAEIEVPATFAPLRIFIRDGWRAAERIAPRRYTCEFGRRYPHDRVCPKCFASFSRKGIAHHVASHRPVAPLTINGTGVKQRT